MKPLLLTIALLFSTPAWAETVLYCQTEIATGIIKENGRWVTANFKKNRFTIKFDEKNMTLSGLPQPMECKTQYKNTLQDIIFCLNEQSDRVFSFSKKSLRFSNYSAFSSAWIQDGTDTATMEHGTCQKF